MEKQIFIIIIYFICNTVFAQQNTYLDALKLKEIYEQHRNRNLDYIKLKNEINSILSQYNLNLDEFNAFNSNPFLSNDFFPYPKPLTNKNGTGGKKNDSNNFESVQFDIADFSASATSQPSWQTLIIKGTSDFLADRFTAELISMATNKSFQKIKDLQTVKSLFPNSMQLINEITDKNSNTTTYALDFNILKNLVKKDIAEIPKNIPSLTGLNPTQKDFYNIGYHIATQTKEGYSIQQIIENLSNSNEIINQDLQLALKRLNILSIALQNKQGAATIWVNPSNDLNFLNTKNDKELVARYFYGLLYEQLKDDPIFKPYTENPIQFVEMVQSFGSLFNQLNSTYELLKSKDFNLKTTEDFITYSTNITKSINVFLNTKIINDYLKIDNITFTYLNSFLSIYEAILNKDYQTALMNTYFMLKETMNLEDLRGLTFLSEIAMVEKSEDVKKILESYTLPIGSSSIKRKSSFNISINGYVGLSGGIERAYINGNRDRGNFGLTAPIGFTISTSDKKRANFSAFFSVIDLGTMVNARFNDTEIENQDVKIEQFFAPGLGIYYNIQKTPISLGLHYSYIKNLKEFTQNNSTVENNFGVGRFNFSILVDIPFFNIYTH